MEHIAEQARTSLGPYCMSICQAKCCKFGQLVMNRHEAVPFLQKCTDKSKLTVHQNGTHYFNLAPACHNLQDSKCSIYTQRPQTCRDYPIYVRGNTVILASSCEGFQIGLLDDYKKECEALGARVLIQ
ncbi:MAG: YkgJ family cysteine cluster protein [Candidatus Woesearchaeota archaeon]